jgi:hypothetical protein
MLVFLSPFGPQKPYLLPFLLTSAQGNKVLRAKNFACYCTKQHFVLIRLISGRFVISQTSNVKLFNFVASLGLGITLAITPFLNNEILAVIFLCGANVFAGEFFLSFYKLSI